MPRSSGVRGRAWRWNTGFSAHLRWCETVTLSASSGPANAPSWPCSSCRPTGSSSAEALAEDLWAGDSPGERRQRPARLHLPAPPGPRRPTARRSWTRPPGYVLQVDDDAVDALQFRSALHPGTPAGRRRRPRRGRPGATEGARSCGAVPLWPRWPTPPSPGQRRCGSRNPAWRAVEDRIEADLAAGSHRLVTGELEMLTGANPLRERLWALRMLALYRSGRHAEALRAYQDLRRLLREELGLEPGEAVRELEAAILRQDRALDATTRAHRSRRPSAHRCRRRRHRGPGARNASRSPSSSPTWSTRWTSPPPWTWRTGATSWVASSPSCRDGVTRFDGHVDKFTGDGIMALFGAPVAYEDHARQACAAALHLREELAGYRRRLERERGITFNVRIGLNSGEVVAGPLDDEQNVEYTAVGTTVGLAQRMESLAEPGTVYVTAATAALVEGYFELRDLGRMEPKGSGEPITVFELVSRGALRTPLEVAAARGFSRFVGRDGGDGGPGRGLRPGGGGQRPGRRRGGGPGGGQEPAVSRVRRVVPGPGRRGLQRPRAGPCPVGALPARAGDPPGAVRDHRRRRPAAARAAIERAVLDLDGVAGRQPSAPVRLPRCHRSGTAHAGDGSRGPPASALRSAQPVAAGPQRPGRLRHGGRGPALARPGERGVPGERRQRRARHPPARRDHLPARVPRPMGPPVALRPAAAVTAGGRRQQRAVRRSARPPSLARRNGRAGARALWRQSLLHPGGRPEPGRRRHPRRLAGRLRVGPDHW